MSNENSQQLIAELRQQKTEIAQQIKELEETPAATSKPIWFLLIRIIAIAMVGVFIANYKAGFVALGVFVLVLIIGILDRVLTENKNRKRNNKIIALKSEEARLIGLITSANSNSH